MACVFGCTAFIAARADEGPDSKAPLVVGLIVGFGGSWLVTFLIVWARFGWKAARSMKMGG